VKRYRYDEQQPPEPRPVAPGVVMRFEGIYEVDPELMGRHFHQLPIPNWDIERLVASRTEHLNWMHSHFADETIYLGEESEATEDAY
jgi:hypothetical protein